MLSITLLRAPLLGGTWDTVFDSTWDTVFGDDWDVMWLNQ